MPDGQPLIAQFDTLLADLDGVVYVGPRAVPFAAEAIEECRRRFGVAVAFVTNNASRTPDSVASQLRDLGLSARPADVVTSAQAAASYLARLLPAGSKVLVVGGDGLLVALTECGLVPVSLVRENPVALVQGFDPDVSWRMLAQAAGALHQGVPWVASNLDLTLPTELGSAPGNGSLVATLTTATGRVPISVGKPEAALILEGVRRTGSNRPLVVGDRLDTDIAAAHAAESDSFLVLTGISTPADLCVAPPNHRPTYVGADLRDLLVVHPEVELTVHHDGRVESRCCDWLIAFDGDQLIVTGSGGDRLDGLRALARLCWSVNDSTGTNPSGVAQMCQQIWSNGERGVGASGV
ncbi:MAG: HAD-IIA family hydrolase [Actinomycetes bacterium]